MEILKLSSVLFFILLLKTTYAQKVGSPCRVNRTLGRCKTRENCPQVINEFKEKNIQPKICAFDFDVVLVCCPLEASHSTPTTTTTTTTTSTTERTPEITESNENTLVKEIFRREPRVNVTINSVRNPPTSRNTERRISVQKCEEYRKYSIREAIFSPLLVDPIPIVREVPVCDTVVPLIVGGEEAKNGEFPHTAALGYQDSYNGIEWRCGGSLISEKFVVTAAHCVKTVDGNQPVVVRLGDRDLTRNDDGADPIDCEIKQFHTHPSYQSKYAYNDISLIELSKTVNFSDNIRPACLWQNPVVLLDKATAIGYGKTDFSNGDNANKLLKVVLFLNSNADCQKYYNPSIARKYNRGIIDSQICAGHTERKDTCQGDSGGGLSVVLKENRCLHYLIGITSSGRYCGGDDPGVYTRVSSFIDWIESVVWK